MAGKKDPTLNDVLEVINERFTLVEGRIDQRFGILNERANSVDARLGVIERGQGKIQNQIADLQEDVTSALHASDNDGTAILNHEKRIAGLEKLQGIKPSPPKHLAGFE